MQQPLGLTWIGTGDSLHERSLKDEQRNRLQQTNLKFSARMSGKTRRRDMHARQENEGLADQWYLDDRDILCHPLLFLPFLQAFDAATGNMGAERNPQKTDVIYYVGDLDAALLE